MTAAKWTEKYRPNTLKGVLGNGKAISELRGWAQSWEEGSPEKKAAILYGPAGVGKTSAALALAEEMGWDLIEMNASDDRTAKAIEKVAGSASKMRTFSGKRRLVILDEADNLYGRVDRGGTGAMLRLVRATDQPTVLIANEYYDISKPLRDACLGIRFRSIRKTTVASLLREICKAEEAKCTPELIEEIAEMSGGDLRSAVNDLQAAMEGAIEFGQVATAERDSKSTIFEGLAKILRGKSPKEAVQITYSLDENPEDLIHWIDENLPSVYEKEDLALGYDCLSRADVFLGRVRRRQNYGLWRYASFMMTGAVQAVRKTQKGGYVAFRPPSLWRKMGQTKGARNVRDSAAKKIGVHCHVGSGYAKAELMGFFGLLLKNKELAPKVAALIDLAPEEIALLIGSKPTTKKVARIYDEAQRLLEEEKIAEIEFGWGGPWPAKEAAKEAKEGAGEDAGDEAGEDLGDDSRDDSRDEPGKAAPKEKEKENGLGAGPEEPDQAGTGQKSLFDF